MEVEFLAQLRYNLFVSPEQWQDWKLKVSKMYLYSRDCLRTARAPKYTSAPVSPIVSEISNFPEHPYVSISSSPFRLPMSEPVSSPLRPLTLPMMDDPPSSASAALHARVSRKRNREDPTPSLQPPPKRYHPYAQPLGIQIPVQPQPQRNYFPQDKFPTQSRPVDPQHSSPSYSLQHTFPPVTTTSPPSFPTSPYAVSPLSPYSSTSTYHPLSPYPTPQQDLYASSPYKYLQNRFSPYAPVRPVRTLPAQFIPPRMQWSMIPPMASEELSYQPIGLHGQSGLRRGVPEYAQFQQFQ
jgi:hypothetical protein